MVIREVLPALITLVQPTISRFELTVRWGIPCGFKRRSKRMGTSRPSRSLRALPTRRLPYGPAGAALLCAEHSGKVLVDVFQLALQVKGVLDLLARHAAGDFLVGENKLAEVEAFFPGAHGVVLH